MHAREPYVVRCLPSQTDSNKDGIIDYGEFVTMWVSVAKSAFKSYDQDGNGSLTPDEVVCISTSRAN